MFSRLSQQALSPEQLRGELQLESRPAIVLFTALKAMGLVREEQGKLLLTDLAAEHLVPGGKFDCGDYIGLAAESPGVLAMVQMLRTNQPAGSADEDSHGTAFIYRDGLRSAMDVEQSARHFTLSLAGRAKNVAYSFRNSTIARMNGKPCSLIRI